MTEEQATEMMALLRSIDKRLAAVEYAIGNPVLHVDMADIGQSGASLSETGVEFVPPGRRLLRSAAHARAYARGEASEGFVVYEPDGTGSMRVGGAVKESE